MDEAVPYQNPKKSLRNADNIIKSVKKGIAVWIQKKPYYLNALRKQF